MTADDTNRNGKPRAFVRGAMFLAFLAAINCVAIYGLPAQIDLTRRGTFTLAPQTRNLLASLQTPLVVTLLAPAVPRTAGERNFRSAALMFHELLATCRVVQPLLQVQELDPENNESARQLLRQFPDAIPPCVVLTFGSGTSARHEILAARDIAGFHSADTGLGTVAEFFGEQALAAALARLTKGKKQALFYAVTGNGELALDDADADSRRGLGALANLLRELDCRVEPLDLDATPRVPADADALIVAGGQQRWSTAAADRFARYLHQGGKGLLLVDLNYDSQTGQPVPLGLEDLLSEFGVDVGNDRIITRGFTGSIDAASQALPAPDEHPLVRSLPNVPLTLFECRSLRLSAGLRSQPATVVPLLISHPTPRAWAEGGLSLQTAPAPGGADDIDGPVTMAVAVERRLEDGAAPALVVVGDAEFAANRMLTGPEGRANSGFLLASLNWLRGRRALLADVPPRIHEGYRLTGTVDDHRGLVWKSSLALWALIATAGVTVWTTRRIG
jgi:gliding motility-associatede transport system auxiliary component